MKRLIAFIPLFALLSCYQTEHNCKEFKTGKFKFEHKVDGVTKTTLFERKDHIEIETYEVKTETASIRLVSDNEYILKKLNPKNKAEEKSIGMKILTTQKDSYTFEFGLIGSDQKQHGKVTRIVE